jgi:hypothetical protein
MGARWIVRLLALTIVAALGATVFADGMAAAAPGNGFPELVDVRLARHDTFDRIVFEFDDAAPTNVTAAWESPPILEDPSGLEVDVAGGAFLRIRMEPASAFSFDDGTPTYLGPNSLTLEGGNVVELVKTGDFEAVMSWVAGVGAKAPFTITTLTGPPRVIVDIKHVASPATPVGVQPTFTG